MALMPETVVAFFDYLCPFAWRGSEVARMVEGRLGLRFEWRHFSVFQADHGDANGQQLWNAGIDASDPMGTWGLQPFLASCAARRQGPEAFDRFRLGLLRARHVDGQPLTWPTHLAVAEGARLHLARFEADLADPELRTCLAQEHHQGVTRDVFGTPTFAFANGHLASFRVRELPADVEEAVRLFLSFRGLLEEFPYLEAVRRPRPQRN